MGEGRRWRGTALLLSGFTPPFRLDRLAVIESCLFRLHAVRMKSFRSADLADPAVSTKSRYAAGAVRAYPRHWHSGVRRRLAVQYVLNEQQIRS